MQAEDRALKVWQTRRIETVLMKWDGIPCNLGHIVPTIKVNSDMWTENEFKNLQRLNGDSELEPKPCHEYDIMSRHSVMFGHGIMMCHAFRFKAGSSIADRLLAQGE